jgi:lysophospholipase L1-like esterase
MSVQVSYKKQIIFYLLLLGISFTLLELAANIWWIEETKCSFVTNEIFLDKGEEYVKQLCSDQNNLKMNEYGIFPDQTLNTIKINSLGFRGPEFEIEKPENVYRIFFVGGSTAFGAASSADNTTISGYLQKLFDDDNFNYKIEVINAGKSGFNTITEKKLIFETIQYQQPDLILMYDGWNDIRADYKPELTKNNWSEICSLGEDNGFETIIFLQPILAFSNKKMTQQEYANYLIDEDYYGMRLTSKSSIYDSYFNEANNLKQCSGAYDLRAVFDTYEKPIYFDGGHIADAGNEIVASSIYDLIKEFVNNSHPNYHVIEQSNNMIEQNNNQFESLKSNSEKKEFNYGKIFLQFKNYFSFYKTPIFLDEVLKIWIISK